MKMKKDNLNSRDDAFVATLGFFVVVVDLIGAKNSKKYIGGLVEFHNSKVFH